MAKRFTDTEKWKNDWFKNLSDKHKLLWLYLCDECDKAGFWIIELDVLYTRLGIRITIPEILKLFPKQVELFNAQHLRLLGFIKFQYGILKESNNPHKAVIRRLSEMKELRVPQGYLGTLEDKDEDEDQDKDKDKESVKTEISIIHEINEITGRKFRCTKPNLKLIAHQLAIGTPRQDIVDVARVKYHQWKDNPEMRRFIRIETLYNATKFESYVAEVYIAREKEKAIAELFGESSEVLNEPTKL